MTHLVKCPTLDFGSVRDLRAVKWSPEPLEHPLSLKTIQDQMTSLVNSSEYFLKNSYQLFMNYSKKYCFKVYFKNLLKLNTHEIGKHIKKWEEGMNRHFSNQDIQMAIRHMKKCSSSLELKPH